VKNEFPYRRQLIDKIENLFPGCLVLVNDPTWIQGISDLLILYNHQWAALEVKRSDKEPHQPNQDYYIELMNTMSFAAFIYPENEEQVLYELQRSFYTGRPSRFP
jgi:hypothetical protein